jgi:hypothetical protein
MVLIVFAFLGTTATLLDSRKRKERAVFHPEGVQKIAIGSSRDVTSIVRLENFFPNVTIPARLVVAPGPKRQLS